MEEETPPEVVESHEAPETVEAEDAREPRGRSAVAAPRRARTERSPRRRRRCRGGVRRSPRPRVSPPRGRHGAQARTKARRAQGRSSSCRPKSQRPHVDGHDQARAAPCGEARLLISVDVGEQRVAVLEDAPRRRGVLERPERARSPGTSIWEWSTTSFPGWKRLRRDRPREERLPVRRRDRRPGARRSQGARKIQDLITARPDRARAGGEGSDEVEGPSDHRAFPPWSFLVYVPHGREWGSPAGWRIRSAPASRRSSESSTRRAEASSSAPQPRARPRRTSSAILVFLQRLWKTIQAKAEESTAPELVYEEAELPLRSSRDLFAGDFVGAQITTTAPTADRQLPKKTLAA